MHIKICYVMLWAKIDRIDAVSILVFDLTKNMKIGTHFCQLFTSDDMRAAVHIQNEI